MKNTSLLFIALPQQFSGAIIVGVECKVNPSVFDLQPKQFTQYVSPNEAAQLFNVDIKTIRNWSRRGKLKFYKYGARIFYKLHELIQVITQ